MIEIAGWQPPARPVVEADMTSSEISGASTIGAGLGMPLFTDPLGRFISRAAMVLAIAGITIICVLACMLCLTIIGRKLFAWQVAGDHELVQIFAALSVSMLFPWCQITGGNVIVDLLTSGLSQQVNNTLDRIGSLLLGAFAFMLAWRTGILAEQTFARGTFTPMLAWPVWLPQALMIPGLLLTGVTGMYLALVPRALSERDATAEHAL